MEVSDKTLRLEKRRGVNDRLMTVFGKSGRGQACRFPDRDANAVAPEGSGSGQRFSPVAVCNEDGSGHNRFDSMVAGRIEKKPVSL